MILEKTNKPVTKIRCPKCDSENIGQYRMPTGPIWCSDCGYRVEHKESDDSFIVREN